MKNSAIAFAAVAACAALQSQRDTEATTKTVFCMALDGEGVTGVNWYAMKSDRDQALSTTGATEEIAFEIQVPLNLTGEQITKLVDEAAWDKSYLALTEAA